MRKMKLLMALLILLPSLSFGQSYILKSSIIDEGGKKIKSSGYICQLSIAQQTASEAWIKSPNYKAIIGFWNSYISTSGIEDDQEISPSEFYLYQNIPNPVVSGTYIEYALPKATKITLKVYDVMGRAIRTLVTGSQNPGIYKIYWDCRDNSGNEVASGIYFYRMEAKGFRSTKKMIVLR